MGRKSTEEIFLEDLQDKEFAAEYLRGCLEDGPEVFNVALLNVARAQGSISRLSETVNLSRTGLYRSLDESGRPAFESVYKILLELGFRLDVVSAGDKEAA